ncbi:hypothetical protein WG922_21070 [Ramlibacter sp. AN1015]|uniref:hypothetical protein n=1 Tax=Ramlibacter sp. AN1015 TaxID=3133428 RepID=UPI0030C477D9
MSADLAASAADGALYLLRQPMALAVLTSVLLVARDVPRRDAAPALAWFASAATCSLALEPEAWHPAFVAAWLAALGGICAADLRPRLWGRQAACGISGLALGLSGGLPTASGGEAIGTILLACLLLVVAHTGWQLASARGPGTPAWQVAPRVLAAWLAAMGLLMLALALRG